LIDELTSLQNVETDLAMIDIGMDARRVEPHGGWLEAMIIDQEFNGELTDRIHW
jgi:hypothetical protein